MTFNPAEYTSNEIPNAEFPGGYRHYFYRFPNGRGAHVVGWPDRIPGFTMRDGSRVPDADLTGRNWDVGFQSVGDEPATRWQSGLDGKKMLEALESAFTAPQREPD